jgi:chromosome transmission fidelity protein 1
MNLNYNGDGAKENMGLNIKQGTTEESSKMYLVNDFVTELDLENLNLFKLLNFLEESNLSNKLLGFTNKNQKDQKEVTIHVKSRGTQPEFISKHTSPLRQIQDLIRSLATPDEDGRIILSRGTSILTRKRNDNN